MNLTWSALGDRALVLTLDQCDTQAQRQLHWLAKQLAACQGVSETVPGMGNLTLLLESPACPMAPVAQKALALWQERPEAANVGKLHRIPVRYKGPDLHQVAEYTGLTEDKVIARHSQVVYEVAFVGFMPGFAYLTGMDKRLAMPRRAEPRLQVPAGAVAIAGQQTGIYPRQSPGGWQIIGYTDSPLFDINQRPPALLQPGDQIQFEVSRD
ncbi:5-oxoprolinase subunit PxpB [Gallaecimonas pentaromativorans]|uniref:KipI family sensor histidine kinase inhibitor n=1 Tax=Gallaecimonas pentaromativorans TaxID=584787 RepID=A0A3N1PTE2_9GAMM|nr:5-oxoprolinase subunit PxpB [Gallaecimonas pentaromativorans]ROQ30000.1 KipI family sensor histidine kinase inhibitor [Gallaecimonas pentaromativorans]